MVYALFGFVLGFIVPYMARRFAKFMPATAGETFWYLLPLAKQVKFSKKLNHLQCRQLLSAYFWRSFVFGFVTSALFVLASLHFEAFGLKAVLAFLWALILLFEIDYKTFLLPDIITVPLLIGGFWFSVFCGTWVMSAESALGAAIGFVLPVLAELLLVWRHKNAFGLGDVKLLAAVGAWFGIVQVVYVILLASLLFAGFALIRKRRDGAFGPAITAAAIIVAFCVF